MDFSVYFLRDSTRIDFGHYLSVWISAKPQTIPDGGMVGIGM
jgi:hypothetical protein